MNNISNAFHFLFQFGMRGPPSAGAPAPGGQQTVASLFGNQGAYPMRSNRALSLTDAVADYIVTEMQPISIVEREGFRRMLLKFDSRYKVPGRTFFSQDIIPEKYYALKGIVKEELSNCTSIAYTTDFWTSMANDSYITITAHFVDENWDLQERLLLTRAVQGSHNADHVADMLTECEAEWDLQDKNPTVVTDNARNMVNAANQLDWDHVGCFAHTLNLSVCRAYKVDAMSRILARARKLVGHFRRSPGAAQVLKEKQELLGLPIKKLIQDVPTRWNSAHDMLARLLEQQAAVCATVLDPRLPRDVRHHTLSTDEVVIAEAAVELLEPFKTTTTLMCSGSQPTASLILPITNTLLTANLSHSPSDSTAVTKMKKEIRDDLGSRYPVESPTYSLLLMSSALDPRFKALTFVSADERQEVHEEIVQQTLRCNRDVTPMDNEDSAEAQPPKKARTDDALASLFGAAVLGAPDTREATPPSKEESIRRELADYEREAPIPVTADPLAWWKVQAHRLPKLGRLAKRMLGIPGTSVPAERVFSAAGATVTARRSNLSPENVDRLLFLNKNTRKVSK